MKTFFPCIEALVFDIDLTLYRHQEYYDSQGHMMVEKYALTRNQSLSETLEQFAKLRAELGSAEKLASYTLALETLGIPVEEQSNWKNELFKPEDYLQRDEELVTALKRLSESFSLFAFTNNTREVAARTLAVLGVEEFFEEIWGSADIGEPKPTIKPYNMIAERLGIAMHSIAAVGDRYQVDLAKPVEHGAAGILVESMADVYALPELLAAPEKC